MRDDWGRVNTGTTLSIIALWGCLGAQILSQFPVQLCCGQWKKGWRFQNSPIKQLEIPNLESVSCNALEISLVFHFPWSSAAGPSNAFVLGLFYGFLVYQGGGRGGTYHASRQFFLSYHTSRKSRIFTTWRSISTWSRIFTIWRNQGSRNEKKGHNTIGQSNNAFSILGFSLARKRRVHVLIFSSIGW